VRLRSQQNNRLQLRARDQQVLSSPTLFVLAPPNRIARLASEACSGE